MKTMKPIKELPDWRGHSCLYECNPPYLGNEFVIISALERELIDGFNNILANFKEVSMFPATKEGKAKSYDELAMFGGNLSHKDLIESVGYELV